MLSEALRLIRVFHKLKQHELATRLGVSKSHISEIEGGKKTPSLELIQRYADEFKMPASSILFFSEKLSMPDKQVKGAEKLRLAIANKILRLLQGIEAGTEGDGNEGSASKKND